MRMRVALTVLIVILALCLGVVAAAPALLSSESGKRTALGMVNNAIPGTLEIETLTLRWFGGQHIGGLTLRDPEARTVATLEEASTELTMFQALRRRLTLGETRVIAPRLELIVDEAGRDNLSAALGDAEERETNGAAPLVPPTGNLLLERGYLSIDMPGSEPIVIDEVSAGARLDAAQRDVSFELSARNRQGAREGHIALTGAVTGLLGADGRLTPAEAELELDGTIEELPLAAVDHLGGFEGLLLAALGEQLSARLSAEQSRVTLEARTPLAELALSGRLAEQRFALTEPAALRWRLTPGFVAAGATEAAEAADALTLDEAVDVTLALERLDLPLTGFDPSAVALGARLESAAPIRLRGAGMPAVALRELRAELTSDDLAARLNANASARIEASERSGHLRLTSTFEDLFDADGHFQGERMGIDAEASLAALPTPLLDRLAGADGMLVAALGPELDLEAGAVSGVGAPVELTIALESETLRAGPLRLRIEEERLELAERATIGYRLTPALLETLAAADDGEPGMALAAPAEVELAVELLSLPMPGPDAPALQPDRSRLEAVLSAERLALIQPDGVTTRLDGLRVTLAGDPLSDIAIEAGVALAQSEEGMLAQLDASPLELRLAAGTALAADGALGDLAGRMTLESRTLNGELPFRYGAADATFELTRDARVTLAAPPPYEALFGSELVLTSEARIAFAEPLAGSAALSLDSQRLELDAAFELAEALTLARPAQLRFTLTPEGYAALMPNGADGADDGLRLAAAATLESRIEHLDWPLGGDGAMAGLPGLEASASIAALTLEDAATGERFTIDAVEARLTSETAAQRMQLAFSGEIDGEAAQPGRLALEADLAGGFDEAGALDPDLLTLDVDGRLERMPSAIIDRFLDMEGLVAATLGPHSDTTLETRLEQGNGPMDLTLRSSHARADMKAQWREGTLTLREPFVAEVSPTEEFGRLVLSMVHPIFETMREREEAIRFEMPVEGVSLPIRDYALEDLAIPEMRLSLGTVTLEGGWMLDGLTGIAQRFGRLQDRGEEWEAEFTPAVVALADGRLEYRRRLDLLLGDRIHLASWGSIDLVEETADLMLAVMPITLRHVFRIAAREGDALHIPVRGPIGAGAVDYSRVATEIGRLQAQQQIGERSALLGALAGAVAGREARGERERMPPPSVSPLPWQERLERELEGASDEPAPEQEGEDGGSDAEDALRGLIDRFRR